MFASDDSMISCDHSSFGGLGLVASTLWLMSSFLVKIMVSNTEQLFRGNVGQLFRPNLERRISSWQKCLKSSTISDLFAGEERSRSVQKVLIREEKELKPSLHSLQVRIFADTTKLLRCFIKDGCEERTFEDVRQWFHLMETVMTNKVFAKSRQTVQGLLKDQASKLGKLVAEGAVDKPPHAARGLPFFQPHMFFLGVASNVDQIGTGKVAFKAGHEEWEADSGELVFRTLGLDSQGLQLLDTPEELDGVFLAGVSLPYRILREQMFSDSGELCKLPDVHALHEEVICRIGTWANQRSEKILPGHLSDEDAHQLDKIEAVFRAALQVLPEGLRLILQSEKTRRCYAKEARLSCKQHIPRRPTRGEFQRDIFLLGKRSHFQLSPCNSGGRGGSPRKAQRTFEIRCPARALFS